jgi:topoisomerase-4 subunit A
MKVEDLGRGMWQIVVTEIPYQVQKARLIEKIAEQIQDRSLTLLDDIRDESAEDIRLVLVPRSKNIDPDQLMGVMFKQSDLEIRFAYEFECVECKGRAGGYGLARLASGMAGSQKRSFDAKKPFSSR